MIEGTKERLAKLGMDDKWLKENAAGADKIFEEVISKFMTENNLAADLRPTITKIIQALEIMIMEVVNIPEIKLLLTVAGTIAKLGPAEIWNLALELHLKGSQYAKEVMKPLGIEEKLQKELDESNRVQNS